MAEPPFDPYAPPVHQEPMWSAPSGEPAPLATRGQRFFARLVDNLLGVGVGAAGFYLFADGLSDFGAPGSELALAGTFFLYMLPLSIVQWVLITASGQSLGKKLLKIKIVQEGGAPVGFVRGVALREWIVTALGVVPVVGRFIGLVDSVMIFGQAQKCLHDMLAGTKVVSADPIFDSRVG
jgi:uncharacterized RDD family membrane protein YckC